MLTMSDLRAHTDNRIESYDNDGAPVEYALGSSGFGVYGSRPPGSGTIASAQEQYEFQESRIRREAYKPTRTARDFQRGFVRHLKAQLAGMSPDEVAEYVAGLADMISERVGCDYAEVLTSPEVAAYLAKLEARGYRL